MKLFQIIKKNFLMLLRSKTSALIILLGPLLVMFLVGMAFNKASTYNILVGYYSSEYSDLSNSFVKSLSEKYTTTKYSDLDNCISDVKLGVIHTCIEFPSGLKMASASDEVKEIVFYVDSSRINLVEAVVNTVSDLVRKESGQITTELTEIIIDALKETQQEISSKRSLFKLLQQENTQLKANAGDIQAKLDSLDTKMSAAAFKIDALNTQIDALKGAGINAVGESKKGLLQVRSKITSTNATSDQKTELYNLIDTTTSKLDNVVVEIENLTNASDLNALSWIVYNIQENINGVQKKLDKVSDARSNVTVEITEINTLLDKSRSEIVTLESSVNGIYSGIEGIKIKDVEKIVRPVKTRVSPVIEQTKLNYLVPTLLVIVVMFVSILLATTLVVMEKNSPARFRNDITPTGDFTFFLGIYITALILLVIQVSIMLGINAYVFKAFLSTPQIINISLILFLIITAFILIGMVIGYLFMSEETATLAAVSVGSVFLFVSGTILPLESVPQYVLRVINYNPFVLADSLVKKIYLFATELSVVVPDIKLLGLYCVALVVLALLAQKLSNWGIFDRSSAKFFLFFFRRKQRKEQKLRAKVREQVKEQLIKQKIIESKAQKDKDKKEVKESKDKKESLKKEKEEPKKEDLKDDKN